VFILSTRSPHFTEYYIAIMSLWNIADIAALENEFDFLSSGGSLKNGIINSEKSSTDRIDDICAWFEASCADYLQSQVNSPWSLEQFLEELRAIIHTSIGMEDLEVRLFELIGAGGVDFISKILCNQDSLKIVIKDDLIHDSHAENGIISSRPYSSIPNLSKQLLDMKDALVSVGFDEAYLERERFLGLQGGSARMWSDSSERGDLLPVGTREYHEKIGLPKGTVRRYGPGFEEVFIPAPRLTSGPQVDLISINEIDEWARAAFLGTAVLNRIQSRVFHTAYYSSENMLVCAPTGAGQVFVAVT
jgi:hypothetical protein